MNRNLLILGAGGHGRVVKEVAGAMGVFVKIDFLDDHSETAIGALSDSESLVDKYHYAFVALGNSELRMEWLDKLEASGYIIPILVHPTAYISPSAKVLSGTVVEAKAMVNTNAVIEKGCIIDLGSIVDHDARISFGCHIDCGAIVKAQCIVDAKTKVDSGVVLTKECMVITG